MLKYSLAKSAFVTDTPSLLNLPPELKIAVFQSLDDLPDVAALAQTCRLFKDICMFNAARICDAVLPRVIECYEDARTLVEVQVHDEKKDIPDQDRKRVAIQQAKRYLFNQDAVRRICSMHESGILQEFLSPQS